MYSSFPVPNFGTPTGMSTSFHLLYRCIDARYLPALLRLFLCYGMSFQKDPFINTFCKSVPIIHVFDLYFFPIDYYKAFYKHSHHPYKTYALLIVPFSIMKHYGIRLVLLLYSQALLSTSLLTHIYSRKYSIDTPK